MKPQIAQITQIFISFLFVFSQLLIFPASQLPSFRVPLCNFVANFLVIFLGTAMIPRLHAVTNENPHHRAAQHRGSTRRVAIARFL